MIVEYLVTIELKGSFCKTKKSFLNFLQSDSDIALTGKKASYLNKNYEIEVSEENSPSDKHKIFHIKVNNQSDDYTEEFSKFLRVLRSLLNMASKNNVQTLWDDISYTYSLKAYPLIHELENLLRKLITKFMLTNVGLSWSETAIPDELKKIRKDKKSLGINNYLYDTDFIQLSNFLFDAYRTQDLDSLIKKIKDHGEDSIKINEINEFIPKSNWQRYFQKHVDCEASLLKSRWEKLYILRCKIAHNNFFEKNDYESLKSMSDEIKPIIESAIFSLEKITIPEEEREELAENVAISSNYKVGEFLVCWKNLERVIFESGIKYGIVKNNQNKKITIIINELSDIEVIGKDVFESIIKLNNVRNIIVHSLDFEIDDYDIDYYIQLLKSIIEKL
ncbi:HEPN domain-containing protein [Pectobacterium brasiliense]|uniref:HEPN domain-containing protein n=3 Tax=Pectobacterium brasiliense TaxID=180957 RepID=UPI0006949FA0|nr:HEPN domain-containing protein [Pectobacterium brasiliense]